MRLDEIAAIRDDSVGADELERGNRDAVPKGTLGDIEFGVLLWAIRRVIRR
jgi:hypothetical protein